MISRDLIRQEWPTKARVVNDKELVIQAISNLTPLQNKGFQSGDLFVGNAMYRPFKSNTYVTVC